MSAAVPVTKAKADLFPALAHLDGLACWQPEPATSQRKHPSWPPGFVTPAPHSATPLLPTAACPPRGQPHKGMENCQRDRRAAGHGLPAVHAHVRRGGRPGAGAGAAGERQRGERRGPAPQPGFQPRGRLVRQGTCRSCTAGGCTAGCDVRCVTVLRTAWGDVCFGHEVLRICSPYLLPTTGRTPTRTPHRQSTPLAPLHTCTALSAHTHSGWPILSCLDPCHHMLPHPQRLNSELEAALTVSLTVKERLRDSMRGASGRALGLGRGPGLGAGQGQGTGAGPSGGASAASRTPRSSNDSSSSDDSAAELAAAGLAGAAAALAAASLAHRTKGKGGGRAGGLVQVAAFWGEFMRICVG